MNCVTAPVASHNHKLPIKEYAAYLKFSTRKYSRPHEFNSIKGEINFGKGMSIPDEHIATSFEEFTVVVR